MISNPYQKMLAERTLVEHPSTDGEDWEFTWFVDPISSGLSKRYPVRAHVYPDGNYILYSPLVPRDEEEALAQEQIATFITERYEEFGLHEEDSESWD